MSNTSNRSCPVYRHAVDYISNLPDTILSHILSFIPTKSAVKTSILSKRWKYLWTKVPVLDFTEMTHSMPLPFLTWQERICFRSFVDRVLLHNEVTYVQRLHLCLCQQDDDFYMKAWLNAIAKREIHEINILLLLYNEIRQVVPLVLPTKFLSMESLVVLKLHGELAIDDPISLCLPKLEIIHLIGLLFPNDVFMKRLSAGCPVLKVLLISDCDGITNMLYVESLTLKTLEIMHTVRKTQQACIVIKAPNLRHLRIEDDLKQHVVGELSSVVEANFDFEYYDDFEYVFQFVRKVSGVRTLQLVSDDWLVYESQLPIFQNLACLKLSLSCYIYKLLKCAPRLKTLVFTSAYDGDDSFESKPVPKCLACLESVEFHQFEASQGEMSLVAYFLKTASVLKEMKTDICSSPINREWLSRRDVCQRLLMFPRSSAACQVEVH